MNFGARFGFRLFSDAIQWRVIKTCSGTRGAFQFGDDVDSEISLRVHFNGDGFVRGPARGADEWLGADG
jgi:hypothetical protein